MTKEVKLLGCWYSPFSRRVELGLRLKRVDFEYVEEDLSNKSPLLLESNPVHKKVPVLLHNGKPVAESMIILEYIDESWPSNHPLLPKDPYERAKVRFWAKFVDDTLLHTGHKTAKPTERERERDEILEQVWQQLELLENELEGKEFFGGETIGFLDIMAFYIINWFQIIQQVTGRVFFKEERSPALHKWIAKLYEMEVVKESLPPRDEHLAQVRARLETLKAASQ